MPGALGMLLKTVLGRWGGSVASFEFFFKKSEITLSESLVSRICLNRVTVAWASPRAR